MMTTTISRDVWDNCVKPFLIRDCTLAQIYHYRKRDIMRRIRAAVTAGIKMESPKSVDVLYLSVIPNPEIYEVFVNGELVKCYRNDKCYNGSLITFSIGYGVSFEFDILFKRDASIIVRTCASASNEYMERCDQINITPQYIPSFIRYIRSAAISVSSMEVGPMPLNPLDRINKEHKLAKMLRRFFIYGIINEFNANTKTKTAPNV